MLALRPPEYFPRLAYFALLLRADRAVVADTFQYSRQSYQNRARIVTPDGPMWLSVPLVGGQHGTPIHRVCIDGRGRWAQRHLKALQFNYGAAPFYEAYLPAIEETICAEHETLGALTVATVRCLAGLLGLAPPEVLSESVLDAPATLGEACDALAPAGLLVLPDTAAHDRALVAQTRLLDWRERPRHQPFGPPFIADCSALDALMMYGPDARSLLMNDASTGAELPCR